MSLAGDGLPEKIVQKGIPLSVSRTGPLLPGHILDGRFQVTKLLNKGGMASVFEAVDLSTGQMVAL